jgi:spermidine/putrescine ABC transporter ATP-binding subunit
VSGAGVSIRGIRRVFEGAVVAVHDLSLEIPAGQFTTILGPSGSGKTTTLMMLAGFESPDAGSIWIDDRDVTTLPAHKRNVGMVFQSYALFPHMSVADNIAYPLRMRGFGKRDIAAAVERALALVRLEGYNRRLPRQLSGGQQQRVALARATVFQPSLLLMDEPLGALDRKLRLTMQSEIKRIQRALGITVVSVTHDQEEALTMSDRIIVMHEGRIEQQGTPADVYERPVNPFVADFVGEANIIAGTAGGDSSLHVGSLRLPATALAGLPAGAPATLALRPERIDVFAPEGAAGSLDGVIEEFTYAGDATRLVVRTGDLRLVAKAPSRSLGFTPARDQAVRLAWSPDAAVALTA